MRYKDNSKRKQFRGTDEIRRKYEVKPIIALYQDEADAIIDNVLEEGMIEGFYEWLGEWKQFIFKEANFVVKPRAKGESMYLAYEVKMDRIKVTAFSDDTDDYTTFVAYPDNLDIEDMSNFVVNVADNGDPIKSVTLSTSRIDRGRIGTLIQNESDKFAESTKNLESEIDTAAKILKSMGLKADKINKEDPKLERFENKMFIEQFVSLGKGFKLKGAEIDSLCAISTKVIDHLRGQLFDCGKRRTALTVLAALYYFQIRIPKTYLDGNETHTEGYKKHNDLYNPLKRLSPPAIVRPRNGTRSWFEQQRMKHTESWHVKGHSRVLKAERYKEKRGQTIWINPFIKGSGEGMRLSIYADQIAGKDVVELEEA